MAIAGLLLAVLVGFVLVNIILAGCQRFWTRLALSASLGAGLGVGLLSILYFLWINLPGAGRIRLDNRLIVGILTLLALAASIGLVVHRFRQRERLPDPAGRETNHTLLNIVAGLLLVCAAYLALSTFALSAMAKPHGEWDAFAIWNFHARFLFRAGENWRDLITSNLTTSHVEYPLLTPAMIALSWGLAGKESTLQPILLAGLFTFSAASLVFSSVYLFRNFLQAALAAIVILCTPEFIFWGASQYADIPIGFYYLATIVLLVYYETAARPEDKVLLLAGMMAGLSAWTKNEGLGFIVCLAAGKLLLDLRYRPRQTARREWLALGSGCLAVLAVLWLYKSQVDVGNLIVGQNGAQMVARLFDLERYRIILSNVSHEIFSRWGGGMLGAFLLLIVWAVLQGRARETSPKAGLLSLMIPLLTLAVYMGSYLISPYELQWHIAYSIARLMAQLFPSFVFCTFYLVRAPLAGYTPSI